jgi:hypothetical protein
LTNIFSTSHALHKQIDHSLLYEIVSLQIRKCDKVAMNKLSCMAKLSSGGASDRLRKIEERELTTQLGDATQRGGNGRGGVALDEFRERFKGAERESVAGRFNQFLKDRFTEVPSGFKFESRLPNVESIRLDPASPAQPHELPIRVQFRDHDSSFEEQIFLRRDGTFYPYPPRLARIVTPDTLLREVVNAAEAIRVSFWHEVSVDILPDGTWPQGEEAEQKESPERSPAMDQNTIDRLRFLTEQPGVAFGFYGSGSGFSGYHGVVFRDGFIVLEHPDVNNAVYFVDDILEICDDEMSAEDIRQYIGHLVSRLQVTKREMVEAGSRRIIHVRDWPTRMRQEITNRQTVAVRRRAQRRAA